MLISLFCVATLAHGNAYTPQDPQQIIATWDKSASLKSRNAIVTNSRSISEKNSILSIDKKQQSLSLVKTYLQQAQYPGYDYLYGVSEALLKPFMNNTTEDTELLLLWAQIQQHQHQFAIAQTILQKIIARDPNSIRANLMIARLALIQGKPSSALTACLRLLGKVDLLTFSACSLEARSVLGETELAQSYAQLKQLYNTQGSTDSEYHAWILQMLADMAMQLEKPQEALAFLETIKSNNQLSVLVQWADIHLALKNYQLVINQLINLEKVKTEDSLLIRLAIAEKNSTNNHYWQTILAPHIALREAREDQAHAADLAIYYLDIATDPHKALYWAERNWQQAQEVKDKLLLTRAQRAVEQSASSTNSGRT